MIANSRLVFVTVLIASGGMHLGAMTLALDGSDVLMEGGAQVADSSLGSSFVDLAEGVQQPVDVSQAVQSNTAKAGDVTPLSPEKVTTAALTPPPEGQRPDQAAAPLAAMSPAQTIINALKPDTVLAAVPQTTAAPPVSVRPKPPLNRPDPPKPAPEKARVKPEPQQAKAAGNASRNAKAGTQTGKAGRPAQPRAASKAISTKAQGNAAASNYPGQVMRRISRMPRPRTSARGVAVIQFSIAANGGLASSGIAKSSGSAALDRAALAVVRKAQPFPPPPSGARRTYSIKIKGQ